MNCPSCRKPMGAAMFMKYWLCFECDEEIKFSDQDDLNSDVWKMERRKRIEEQVRKDFRDFNFKTALE